ncbi:MAG: cysteine dioxygenase [Vicingaceae bacterium]|jgi:cysteine dioxygenase
MDTIKTVDKLKEVLEQKVPKDSYLEIMQSIDIPIREFEKYYSWKKDGYSRNCLIKTNDFELLLICYEKGQETPIHDFDSNQAWIHTLQGSLIEERFRVSENGNKLEQLSSMTISPNDYSFMSKVGIHRYKNVYEARTVSLNLYCKPIEHWTEYDNNAKAKEVKVGYDAVYV